MKRSELLFGALRIPVDAWAVIGALSLSYYLRLWQIDLIPSVQLLEPATTLPPFTEFLIHFGLPGVALFILTAASLGLYALRNTRSAFTELRYITVASLLWLVVVIGWYFFVQRELFYSRVLLVHATVLILLFVALCRMLIVLLQRLALRFGIGVRTVVSIGSHELPSGVSSHLSRDSRYYYHRHLPSVESLKNLAPRRRIDLLIHTDADGKSSHALEVIDYCRSHHIGYSCLPPVFADAPHLLLIERIGLTPLISFQPTPLDGWGRIAKRLFDIVFSIVALIMLSPLFIVISLCILVDSGWPIFYRSNRIGLRGRARIPVYKFRSMVCDADMQKETLQQKNERTDGPLFKMKNDPRITRVGRVLRRFDLDELPQLCNVLCGHMSLVGPRPHLPEEVHQYTDTQRRVFAIVPGITGLAQISGRSTLKFEEEVQLDLQYIEEWSLWLDLWILWRTVWVVLMRGEQDNENALY